ncbi:MAG TPA: RICIN domain-containing protein [Chitinophaga sp.]|uniref:RICIN domain-containing protein n=1 Tax=Chitinophaga sp. TaxID=1869181 RepID=UPI002C53374D|nr:RICIN domain-containing protein [Chitinophaga sp.]HVI44251.1 RICIN domain-containing protein [Chitinophaga sp.]
MNRLFVSVLAILATTGCTKKVSDTHPSDTGNNVKARVELAPTSTADFRGLNWAAEGDNFKDGVVVPSGLNTSDSYAATKAIAGSIVEGFIQRGVNTIRLPVNPASVLGSWWSSYTAAIDTATAKNMKVILAYWEGNSSKDGLVDDVTQFRNMWQAIVNRYSTNSNVYFEIFNEPHGYSAANLTNLYADWLSRYPSAPQERVVLDGVGYAQDVNTVGADSRLSGCLLSYHNYTWFNNSYTTTGDWEAAISAIGYPQRTIVTEAGIPMTNGKNYLGAPGQDREIAYFQGITSGVRARGIGYVYWPGLATGDGYSLLLLSGGTLVTNNASGLSRLQYGWNLNNITLPAGSFDSNAWYRITCRQSGKSLDVNGSSTANGGSIVQWDYWGGNNQQWKINSAGDGVFYITNRNSGKALDVNGISTAGGASIIQWDYWGGANQQWKIVDIGFGAYELINVNSGQALDVNGASGNNGANIIQWYLSGNRNQQWQIVRL